jgi:hypothetical protein
LGKHVAGGCQVVVRKVGRWHRGQYCLCGAMPASGWAERALLCELTLFASTLALLVSVWEWPWFGTGAGLDTKDGHRAVTLMQGEHSLPASISEIPASAASGVDICSNR